MNEKKPPNRLIHEKSPYLLQHAYNPVDWYPWGEEAFEKAKKEDKPVFLSIGYSTCHWCHVMEKESFEDADIAAFLNKSFVCIKVDREERPDIDSVYMTVCQMMTGKGGWPLTIVMTPDKKPFFAATYLPKESRFGLPGLGVLLPKIRDVWFNQRKEVLDSADEIAGVLQQKRLQRAALDVSVLPSAYNQLVKQFDEKHGGFGTSPKFPILENIFFLLRYWKRFNEKKALDMVEKTLKAMRLGGIYDHIGFGFHRYSTDQMWFIPHFEKMLYDQALLTLAYTEAYQVTKDDLYRETAEQVCTYVLRDMTAPEGGFYSAEDADSEGKEGKFYVWDTDEIAHLDNKDVVKTVFNITEKGNFPESGLNSNILHLKKPVPTYAEESNMPVNELKEILERARKTLFDIREKRVHPAKDDKIIADWNGLMIAALSRAGNVFNDKKYTTAAKKAADFIIDTMVDTRLYHRYRDGAVAIPGFVDDYAFFVWGLLELYEATFEPHYIKYAVVLTDSLIDHFWDYEGGFFQTSDERESVLTRQKLVYDGAVPSGNSVAMLNLLRLARITGNTDYEEKALQISQVFAHQVLYAPSSHTFLLTALDFALGPSFEVVIVGSPGADDVDAMVTPLKRAFMPNKVVIFRPDEDTDIVELSPFTAALTALNGKATAYVCRNYSCNLPTTDVETMLKQMNEQ